MFFLSKKIFNDDKKLYLYYKFFESNQNFTALYVKIVKNSGYFKVF